MKVFTRFASTIKNGSTTKSETFFSFQVIFYTSTGEISPWVRCHLPDKFQSVLLISLQQASTFPVLANGSVLLFERLELLTNEQDLTDSSPDVILRPHSSPTHVPILRLGVKVDEHSLRTFQTPQNSAADHHSSTHNTAIFLSACMSMTLSTDGKKNSTSSWSSAEWEARRVWGFQHYGDQNLYIVLI